MRKIYGRALRQKRIRSKIKGTLSIPRLNVFRSNQHIYGSMIDDVTGKTLISVSDKELKKSGQKNKTEKAFEAGVLIAGKAKKKKIQKAVFDRAGYKYHGRVKAFAEGARSEGIKI